LRRVVALYEIEADIRGRSAEDRRLARQQRSRPIIKAVQVWLTEQLNRVSGRSGLAQAMRYALDHWAGLILFLEDGRLELNTNTVERAIRPIVLTRKNALFAGSDSGGRHWSIVATLIVSAKLNDIEPLTWLTDVLERVVSRQTRIHERTSCCHGPGKQRTTPKRPAPGDVPLRSPNPLHDGAAPRPGSGTVC
jgi:transposase